MKKLFGVLILVLIGIQTAFAQSNRSSVNRQAETYMMERINRQLVKELSDFPVNVRRMAVYKINYNANRFNNQSIAYIKGEIETTFRENSPVSVISPPELDPTDKLKIVGSDSTLKIMNIRGRSLADMSPELLEGVADKYSVDGLVELTLQRHQTEGIVVQIRVMNPQSRQISWSRSIAAFPVKQEEVEEKGRRWMFSVGALSVTNESTELNDSLSTVTTVNSSSINFSGSVVYRQPLNNEFSSYLGLKAGINSIQPAADSAFKSSFLEFGITYDQAFGDMNEDINDYRVMFGVDASIWIARGNRSGNLLTLSPSLNFNLTENLGFEVNALILLSERFIQSSNPTIKYTYGQFGYGVKANVRF